MSEGLHEALLFWYDSAKRDLPWRTDPPDPYRVWVSEVMLQQTTVAMATEKFIQWMDRFPTVEALANADEQEVLACWQGLGYYSRAKRLLQGAKIASLAGLPSTFEAWLNLPGIGRYSAGAISSIGQGTPVPLVDGNVLRVYARMTGDSQPYVQAEKSAWKWAEENLHRSRPGDWNQALMELGATICTPRKPTCLICPLREFCTSAGGDPESLPRAKEKPAKKELHEAIFIHFCREKVGMIQIPEGEWWGGMWSFLRLKDQSRDHIYFSSHGSGERLEKAGTIKHVVTHHKVTLDVHACICLEEEKELVWMTIEEATSRPMPAPHRRAFEMALKLVRS